MSKKLKASPFKVAKTKYKVGFFLSTCSITFELAIALIVGGIIIGLIAIINGHVINDLINMGIDDMNDNINSTIKEHINDIFVDNNKDKTYSNLSDFLINDIQYISVLGIKVHLTNELINQIMPESKFDSIYESLKAIANNQDINFSLPINAADIKQNVLNEIPLWNSFIEPNQAKIKIVTYIVWSVLAINIILLAISALSLNAYMMIPTTIITILSLNIVAIIGVILMDTSRKMKVIQVE